MSKKSSVDSNNYYLYPEWFEGGNQSQPSTSSYSYPTLEYIWSNAVRLTRTVHSNLQDEIEYLEKNISGGGGSCNCSELQYGIDKNSTKIYYNSVNITSNADKIDNLSDIKLSRDGSQTMTGLLQCESGLKTDIIDSYSGDTVECSDDFKVDGDLLGDSANGLILKAEDIFAPAAIELTPGTAGKIVMYTGTPQPALLPRLEIPWGSGFVDITVSNAHVIPDIDSQQNLGSPSKRWENIYAEFVHSSNISSLEERIEYLENIIGKMGGRGPYTAIVYKDSGIIYAKNANGDTIAQGAADVDDASVIQSAIDQAGFIFIARGMYLIKESLSIKNGSNYVKIYGELGKTILKAEMDDNLIELGEVGKYNQFIEIGYMALNGNHTSPVGIKMFRQLNPKLTRLQIYYFTDAGIRIGGYTSHAEISGCNIGSNTNYGIDARYGYYETGGVQPLFITNSVIHYNDISIYMHNTMADIASVAFGSETTAVRLLNVKGVVLENCYFEGETYGIKVKQDGGSCKVAIIAPYFGGDVDTRLLREGSPEIEWIGGYNCISKRDTATFSGDGSTTQFSISHGLVSTPSNIQVTPRSEDASGDFYITANTSNIYVNYLSAPPSGTNNIKLDWNAKV